MSKKTDDLLAKAKSMNDESLTDAIEALDFLGGEATANHQEFKDLEALMEGKDNEPTAEPTAKQNEAKTAAKTTEAVEVTEVAKVVDEIAEDAKDAATEAELASKAVDAKVNEALEAGEKVIAAKEGVEPEDVSLESHSLTREPINPVVAKTKTKMPYAGIKMIGNMFYSKKDNYAVGFATADECAAHYNQ